MHIVSVAALYARLLYYTVTKKLDHEDGHVIPHVGEQ